jgi:hypothetical protein
LITQIGMGEFEQRPVGGPAEPREYVRDGPAAASSAKTRW